MKAVTEFLSQPDLFPKILEARNQVIRRLVGEQELDRRVTVLEADPTLGPFLNAVKDADSLQFLDLIREGPRRDSYLLRQIAHAQFPLGQKPGDDLQGPSLAQDPQTRLVHRCHRAFRGHNAGYADVVPNESCLLLALKEASALQVPQVMFRGGGVQAQPAGNLTLMKARVRLDVAEDTPTIAAFIPHRIDQQDGGVQQAGYRMNGDALRLSLHFFTDAR